MAYQCAINPLVFSGELLSFTYRLPGGDFAAVAKWNCERDPPGQDLGHATTETGISCGSWP